MTPLNCVRIESKALGVFYWDLPQKVDRWKFDRWSALGLTPRKSQGMTLNLGFAAEAVVAPVPSLVLIVVVLVGVDFVVVVVALVRGFGQRQALLIV